VLRAQAYLEVSKQISKILLIILAYFGAYFITPLTYGGWVVRRFGYRWAFILGLLIYMVGALMFWPSGVKASFTGFVVSMLIVGSGLSTLETAANPYIATCGPPKYSELRLNLSQSFQAIGTYSHLTSFFHYFHAL
jgi:FHS family L-fucose permease-like MFS transporter